MSKVMKIGMPFEENNIPDFGSIERGEDDHLYLAAADIPKLNAACTLAGCTPFLASTDDFVFRTGDEAFFVCTKDFITTAMFVQRENV